jgi:hypothetical protein
MLSHKLTCEHLKAITPNINKRAMMAMNHSLGRRHIAIIPVRVLLKLVVEWFREEANKDGLTDNTASNQYTPIATYCTRSKNTILKRHPLLNYKDTPDLFTSYEKNLLFKYMYILHHGYLFNL